MHYILLCSRVLGEGDFYYVNNEKSECTYETLDCSSDGRVDMDIQTPPRCRPPGVSVLRDD